jgi:ribose/xylose/arabinose/galactoside ABC-type transport system permease subunit
LTTEARPAPRAGLFDDPYRVVVWLGWATLFAGAAIFALDTHAQTDAFLTWLNLRAILTASAYVGVFAVATTVIMLSGSLFSLSLGITGAITATTFLALLDRGIVVALVATLLLGIFIVGAQGLVVGFFGANPIIVTIAAGGLQTGVFLWITGGATTVPPPGDTSFQWLNNRYFELPLAVYVLFALVIVLEVVMRRTRFGRLVYLVGENRNAAYAAGLPVGLVITGAFAVAGLCIGIVGVELGAFNQSGSLLVESTFTYDGIAAAVVGGTAITGGRGSMVRALAGAVFIATIANMVLLRGYDEGWQILVKGVIVFVVVILLQLDRRRTAA